MCVSLLCVCGAGGSVPTLGDESLLCVCWIFLFFCFLSCYRYREYSFSQLWEALILFGDCTAFWVYSLSPFGK